MPPLPKKATVIKVSGEKIDLGHRPTLEEAQGIVGGYIEFAYCQNPKRTMVVNEEGRINGMSFNREATAIYKVSPIHGNVILLEGWRTVEVSRSNGEEKGG